MGYTNYWYQNKSFTDQEWKKVKEEYDYIKDVCEGIIIDETKNNDEKELFLPMYKLICT